MSDRKILIVEDDECLLMEYARMHITCPEGVSILISHTAEEAVEVIASEKPEIVLLDLYLPGQSGHWVLEQISTLSIDVPPKVYMFTNSQNPEDEKKARELGVEDFCVKTEKNISFFKSLIEGMD